MKRDHTEIQNEELAHEDKKHKKNDDLIERSQFEKLPAELLVHIFSFLDSPESSKVKKLRQKNILRLTCKRFHEIEELPYHDKLVDFAGKENALKIIQENRDTSIRQIYYDLEENIFNYAMSLYGRMMIWQEWERTLKETPTSEEEKTEQLNFYYEKIGIYFSRITNDVDIALVIKYLAENMSPKNPVNHISTLPIFDINTSIFDGTTLLEWMSGLGELSAVKYLLAKGASNDHFTGALRAACWQFLGYGRQAFPNREKPDYMQIISELIKAGANVIITGDHGPLFLDILENPSCTIEILELFLNKYLPKEVTHDNPLLYILREFDILARIENSVGYDNCIKAFDYIFKSSNYENWVELTNTFDEDDEVDEEDLTAYYNATNVYLTNYYSVNGKYPSREEFVKDVLNVQFNESPTLK